MPRAILPGLLVVVSLFSAAVATASADPPLERDSKPNVLMIAIGDLNDWVEPLGGHPQSQTPAIQRIADRGVNFTNAHCQSPLCNSSRTSLLLSLRPSTTGIYGLAPWFKTVDRWKETVSLPQRLKSAGYETYQAGKVYHATYGRGGAEFDHMGPPGGPGKTPPTKLIPPTPAGNNPWVDWGVFEHDEEDKRDYQVAQWSIDRLAEMPTDKPFFLACGFFMPHVPCHSTPKWWNKYDDATLQLPPVLPDDRLDCSPFSWYLHWNLPEPRMSWLEHHDQHKNLVHAYLASITWADHCVGRVLDALDNSRFADNTIIVLWSDHGWHLGENNITGKNTLWERSTHVPLIFAGPGITPGHTNSPAELLDVYPTICDLIGIDAPSHVEGLSLVPQMQDLDSVRSRPAITDHNPGNQGIRGQRYRLIRYADGSEELYDIQNDPHEHHNVIGDADHTAAADRLRKYSNDNMAPLAPGSGARILEKRDDGWYWENTRIDPDNPPMSIAPNQPSDLPRFSAAAR